jgi:hypothetical protein
MASVSAVCGVRARACRRERDKHTFMKLSLPETQKALLLLVKDKLLECLEVASCTLLTQLHFKSVYELTIAIKI